MFGNAVPNETNSSLWVNEVKDSITPEQDKIHIRSDRFLHNFRIGDDDIHQASFFLELGVSVSDGPCDSESSRFDSPSTIYCVHVTAISDHLGDLEKLLPRLCNQQLGGLLPLLHRDPVCETPPTCRS